MKNPLTVFKRHRIKPITPESVEMATVQNPEVTKQAEAAGLRLLHKVSEGAMVASQIRESLAAGALIELRSRR